MEATIVFLLLLMYDVVAQERWLPWIPECRCWVDPLRRAACRYYDVNMEEEKCISLGCCFEEGEPLGQPHCYRPTGFCPPEKCQVPPSERRRCPGFDFDRDACFSSGCCFNQATAPRCYRSNDGSTVPPFRYLTGDKQFNWGLALQPRPHVINSGPNRLIFDCPINSRALPCGKYVQTKGQCHRLGCCWEPRRSGGCWRALFHFQNFLVLEPRWSPWGSWSPCPSSEPCPNYSQRKRNCIKINGNTVNCLGTDTENRTCGQCSVSWGKWKEFGACSSPEPACLIGRKKVVRSCLDGRQRVLSASYCSGGRTGGSKMKLCDSYLCPQFTTWSSSPCTASCGGGTQTQTRQCASSLKQALPSSCYSRTVACNTALCVSDKNLDLLLLLDSSVALDDCLNKSLKMGRSFPYLPGDSLLTPNNFPNFFQQNAFAKSVLALWNDVTLTSTRVAIAQFSQGCNPMTSSGYHVKKYLDSEYDATMLDSTMSYHCGGEPRLSQFTCAVRVLAQANRPHVPDVIIAFIPDMTLYGSQVTDFYLRNIHYVTALTYPATLFTVSAADHSTMSTSASKKNELFCRQMACSSSHPNCGRYLGTIYDNIYDVIRKFRQRAKNL